MSDDVGDPALGRQVGLENLSSPFQLQLFCDIEPLLSTHWQAQVSFKIFWKKTFIFGAPFLMAPGSVSASPQLCSHRRAFYLDPDCTATELREEKAFPGTSPGQAADLYKQHYHSVKLLLQTMEMPLGAMHLLSKCCNKITFQDLFGLHICVY